MNPNWLRSRLTLVIAVMFAGWPVARWYVARLSDGSDEPMGLLALAAALFFVPRRGWSEPLADGRVKALVALLAIYVLVAPFAPPLARAVIWVCALGVAAAPRDGAVGWSALLVLSLPAVATLQFYAGYPLRCATTHVASWLLRLGGIFPTAEGTTLHWAGERVLIDAPCSGIRMLWTLLTLGAALATARQLTAGETLRVFRFAAGAVFIANSVRAVILSCFEAKLWPTPPYGHEGVGLALFSVAGIFLLWTVERRSARDVGETTLIARA